jgi:hypothetical protein
MFLVLKHGGWGEGLLKTYYSSVHKGVVDQTIKLPLSHSVYGSMEV